MDLSGKGRTRWVRCRRADTPGYPETISAVVVQAIPGRSGKVHPQGDPDLLLRYETGDSAEERLHVAGFGIAGMMIRRIPVRKKAVIRSFEGVHSGAAA